MRSVSFPRPAFGFVDGGGGGIVVLVLVLTVLVCTAVVDAEVVWAGRVDELLAAVRAVVSEAIGHHAAFLPVLQESRQLLRIPQYELLVQLMQPSYEQQSVANGMGTGSVFRVGARVGACIVGFLVGKSVGESEGAVVGESVGVDVGEAVGDAVG